MNSDYHELMGVSRLLATAEEKIEELEVELANSKDYVLELEHRIVLDSLERVKYKDKNTELKQEVEYLADALSEAKHYIDELEGGEDIRHDQKLEGMLADLEQMFLDHAKYCECAHLKHIADKFPLLYQRIHIKSESLVEYLRSKGVVRRA